MAFFPDYTPKPQPNMSTTPVDTSVAHAGNHVSAEDVRDQIEETLHIVSKKGGHSATKGVAGGNKLAAHAHVHAAVVPVLPPIETASETADNYPELTSEEIESTHAPERPRASRKKKGGDR